MSEEKRQNEGFLMISIRKIKNISGKKFGGALFNTKIEEQGYVDHPNLQKGFIDMQSTHIFSCLPNDQLELEFFEDNSGACAYIKFPLEKLIQIPRVKHVMEVKMIEKKQNKIIKPLKEMLEVELDIIYINGIVGSLTIDSIEAEFTRDTDIVGEMDPYLVLQLEDQSHSTGIKHNSGQHCIWNERITLMIKDAKKAKLSIKAFDKDSLKDDLICEASLYLLKEGLLKPKENCFFNVNMLYNQKSQGVLKLQYSFQIQPFKY